MPGSATNGLLGAGGAGACATGAGYTLTGLAVCALENRPINRPIQSHTLSAVQSRL
jgi:hypothetical protein